MYLEDETMKRAAMTLQYVSWIIIPWGVMWSW